MAAIFDKLGIRFLYPENWQLDESEALAGNDVITVYSPGGSFWSVMIHPPGTAPSKLAATALEAMRQQYDELDADEVREIVAGHEMVGYDMNFYCLDLTNTALVQGIARMMPRTWCFARLTTGSLPKSSPCFGRSP